MANAKIGSQTSWNQNYVETITTTRQLTRGDSGKVFMVDQGSAFTVNLPLLSTKIAGWHCDYDLQPDEKGIVKTAIFYVNSNNGYTIFKESKKKVRSVENRLVIFPSELEHCGGSCTDNKQRVVINFNFI